MTKTIRALCLAGAFLLAANPASADDASTVLGLHLGDSHALGPWPIDSDRIAPADFFVLPDIAANGLPIPHARPIVYTRQASDTGAATLLALVFSDADVTCADVVGTFQLDTSYATFLTASNADALAAYGASLAETGLDPLNVTGDLLNGAHAAFVTFPNGPSIPVAWVGFEGDFPLYAYRSAQGTLTALAGLFGRNARQGPALPPCTAPVS